MTLQVCIMTPDRIFWNDQADEIILPTNTGQMGVLTNHAPLITALDIGVTLIRSNADWIPVALMGGFALVKQNRTYISRKCVEIRLCFYFTTCNEQILQ